MKTRDLFLSAIIITSTFLSCHTQADSYSSGWNNEANLYGRHAKSKANSFDGTFQNSDRKVLRSATIFLTVLQPDSSNVRIVEIAKKNDGYVSQLGSEKTIIRVMSHKLDQTIEAISTLGRVERKNVSGHDVTEDYLDFKIRLENAEKARQRYLELLEKAENVEAALKVEKELERLNESIDLLKGKMNRVDHLATFSTITIHLKEKKKPGIIGYVGIGIYRSVKWLFVRN
jgi:hypothetical protein